MAPVAVDSKRIREFATEKAFDTWLSKNHDKEAEVYIRIYKKDSGVRSITAAQAIDVVLCWVIDDDYFCRPDDNYFCRFGPS
jgi:uncharacterized protein YdeI (YjbR/CyaY-like superfamily)